MTKANTRNPFGLTHRQCEVMESLARLGDSKLVARDLDIEVNTVDYHILCAVRRMRAKNRLVAAVKWDRSVREGVQYHGERRIRSVFDLAAASNDARRNAA